MKLQPASRKELTRIAIGCSICACAELLGFFVLSTLGFGSFGLGIVFGTLGGTAIAIMNFYMLCVMVQIAAATSDENLRKQKVKLSYTLRMLLQAGWVVAAYLYPDVNVLAAAIPLIFPNIVILYLNSQGKLMRTGESLSVPRESQSDPEEGSADNLNSFEV